MAKKTTLKLWTGEVWEDLFPSTHADLIIMGDGQNNLQHLMNEVVNRSDRAYEAVQRVLGQIEQIEQIAKGAQQAISFDSYEQMVNALKSADSSKYKVGQSIYIKTLNVPDVWIWGVDAGYFGYNYTSDEDFINALKSGRQKVGYYYISQLETGKVNLDYTKVTSNGKLVPTLDIDDYVKSTDVMTQESVGVAKVNYAKGTSAMGDGTLAIYCASEYDISKKSNLFNPLVPFHQDYAWKMSAIDNKQEWTDEDKAKACETIGAVAKMEGTPDSGATRGFAYGLDSYGTTQKLFRVQIQANADTIPLRNPSGNFYVGNPTLSYECANKGYVDDAVANAGGGNKIYKYTLKFGMIGSYDFYVLNMPNYEHNFANFRSLCDNALKIESTMLFDIIDARVSKKIDGTEEVSFCTLTFDEASNEFALQGTTLAVSSFTYEGVTEV